MKNIKMKNFAKVIIIIGFSVFSFFIGSSLFKDSHYEWMKDMRARNNISPGYVAFDPNSFKFIYSLKKTLKEDKEKFLKIADENVQNSMELYVKDALAGSDEHSDHNVYSYFNNDELKIKSFKCRLKEPALIKKFDEILKNGEEYLRVNDVEDYEAEEHPPGDGRRSLI